MATIEERLATLEAEVRALKASDSTQSLAHEHLWGLYQSHTRTLQQIPSNIADLRVKTDAFESRLEAVESRLAGIEIFLERKLPTLIEEAVDRSLAKKFN